MSYNSKYTGSQVEQILDKIENGEVGGIKEEVDPIFLESPASTITEDMMSIWNDKLEGNAIASTEASSTFPQVLFIPLTLTDEQKAIARENIGIDQYIENTIINAINNNY